MKAAADPGSEALAFRETVVTRYLDFFGALVVDMLIPHAPAAVANIGCRFGYPDHHVAEKLGHGVLFGSDTSAESIEDAKRRAAEIPTGRGLELRYQVDAAFPTTLPADSFTHALSVAPHVNQMARAQLVAELRRVLMPGGQALLALPLRGSFPEIADLIREYALRTDQPQLTEATDLASHGRPSVETLASEFEAAGFQEVDVEIQLIAIGFANGREFIDDAIARLVVGPEANATLGVSPALVQASLEYVADAITKYWSEGAFELSVNVGCVSARRS